MDSYTITQIRIKNFKDITEEVVITDVQKCNSMIGLYETLKKDMAHAIIYCMGATANQLQVENIADVQRSKTHVCCVVLYLSCRNRDDKRFERRMFLQETFHVNGEIMGIGEYCENLRNINIDINKQFNFYDARNRSFFWNVETTIRNEFIAKLNGMSEQIVAYNDVRNKIKLVQTNIQCKENELANLVRKISKIPNHLPIGIQTWPDDFPSGIATLLRSDENKRREKIRMLNVFKNELREITMRNDELLEQIQNAERILNELNEENRNFLQELQGDAFQPYNSETIQSLKSRAFLLKSKIEVNTLRYRDGELRLRDLETYKRSIESHLQFMNTPVDQPQDSRFITEDALLKFYQIAHSADELALDKLSLRLDHKEAWLNITDNIKMDEKDFDTIFPQRRFTEAAETKILDSPTVFNEMKSALNSNIDPNTMLYSKSSPEILEKLIPVKKGFLLTSAFRPIEAQSKCMIDNILYDSKYTIVLYNDDKQEIYDMINKKCRGMFRNVHFVVRSELPPPERNFTIPETHWMKYCHLSEKLDDKLIQFIANQKKILRVESHDDVRDEFRRHTRKYVISADGQLTYTRLMNVDVLEYFKPGKKPKNMEIANSNVKKMLDANEKCAEIFASLFEEEHDLQDQNIDDENGLRQEVDDLKRQYEQAKEHRKMQIERLRANLDAPYTVPEPSDFAERRAIEQSKLDDVNGKILAIQEEIAANQAANGNMTTQVTNIENCIGIKNSIKANEASCAVHSKTVKEKRLIHQENEERLRKLNEQITRLKNCLEKLKLSTMRNLTHLINNSPLLNERDAIFTAEILQLLNTEEAIDPETIRLNVPNWIHHNVVATRDFYAEMTDAQYAVSALNESIPIMKDNFRVIYDDMFHRQITLDTQCRRLNADISRNLQILRQQMYPEFKYRIHFHFAYEGENEGMITVHENNQEIQIQNLTTTDQQIIHWMLFTAFHEYTKSPILFIDFRDCLDIITKIDPIINWITNKSQVFCYSSHGQLCTLSTFADMQIAVNRMNEEIPPCILWRRENNPEQMEE